MNRNNEYDKLLYELENTPLKLDFTLERARAKKMAHDKRHRLKKAIFIPLLTIIAVFAIFSALVNFYSPFAETCNKIPVVSDLAETVASPTLRSSVKNLILH